MAENKKSFILYCDLLHTVKKLPKEARADLFLHILEYVNDLNPVIEDNLLLEISFEPIKQQLKRDLKDWEFTKVEKSLSGRIGNLKRWNLDLYKDVMSKKISIEEAETVAKGRYAIKKSQPLKVIAPVAVTVNDNVSVNVNVIPNTENNFKTGLVLEMAKIFKQNNPSIQIDPEVHYPSCLQIAYRIAKIKGWDKQSVLNGKMNDTLESWKSIVEFAKQDTWLSTRSLIDLNDNKEWDRLVMKMSKPVKVDEKKKELDAVAKKTLKELGL